jgi:hypothetical protein
MPPFIGFNGQPANAPLVVLDMGYSARRKSCGLYWTGAQEPVELTFGDAVRQTASLVKSLQNPVLVIEAVLSIFHSRSGNPDIRGEFEKGRGWYYGAGVASFAAALRFLKVLHQELDCKGVMLAEAFLSNKDIVTGHGDDALLIHNAFWHIEPARIREDCEPASPLIVGVPSIRVFDLPR